MAITEKEVLREDTCALLSKLARPGFPVGYARIHSWHINPGDPSFADLLALYYDEAALRDIADGGEFAAAAEEAQLFSSS